MKIADLSNPIALAKIIAESNANSIAVDATGTSYASQTEGFPAVTMIPEEQGGEAPHGLDFNGFLKMLSSHVFNIQNGTPETFNSAVSTLIGGYPKNAQLWLIDNNNSRLLKSTKDDNTDNFLTTPSVIGTSWVDAFPTKDYVDNGLAAKQDTITGAATTITSSNLTIDRALVSNGNGKVSASSTTATELGYVHGVTSAIQTQINAKAADNAVVKLTGNQTISGTKTFSSTISGSINGNAATVTNGVYTTGNQTIGGIKTFSADPSIKNEHAMLYMDDTARTKGTAPSAGDVWHGVAFRDGSSKDMGRVRHRYTSSKESITEIQAHKANASSDTDAVALGVIYPASGTPYGQCPHAEISGNGKIVTTAGMTKAKDGYFKLGNGLIVQWGRFSNTNNNNITLTFPTPFTSTNYSINAMRTNITTGGYSYDGITGVSSRATTSCVLYSWYGNSSYDWIAIGY